MLWRSLIHFFIVAAGMQSTGLLKKGVHEPFLIHFMPFSLGISHEKFSGAFRGYRKRPVARYGSILLSRVLTGILMTYF